MYSLTDTIDGTLRRKPAEGDRPSTATLNRQRQRAAAARLFAEFGPNITMYRVRTAAGFSNGNGAGFYSTIEELRADLLAEHLAALTVAVCAAHDDAARFAPGHLLERLIRAWLDGVAAAPHAHRAFLFCAHALPEEPRRDLDIRLRVIIEMMQDAVAAAVPALAAKSDAALILVPTLRALLSDPFRWLEPPDPAARQADARRFTGMLLAAAEAEAAGVWPSCGGLEGAIPGIPPATIDCRQTRTRLREVLDGA
ncbi:MAG: hypothetical protein ACREF1_13195, partial [Acetobacteraceae bacterium]